MNRLTLSVLVVLMLSTVARADGLRVAIAPPEASTAWPSTPFDLTLQLQNDTAESTRVFFWQTALAFVPESGAQGELEIVGVAGADGRLMDGLSPFGPQLFVPPGGWATASEGDFTFTGAALASGASANLATIHVVPSADAAGTFHLQLAPADFNGFDGSSYWFGEGEPIPIAYGNNSPAPGLIGDNLGVVHVTPEPRTSLLLLLGPLAGAAAGRRKNR